MSQLRRISCIVLLALLISITGNSFVLAAGPKAPAQLDTTAQSAVLMDGNGTVLYEKDPHKPLPPASVTKIMTLLLAGKC